MNCGSERRLHHCFDTHLYWPINFAGRRESMSIMISSGSFAALLIAIVGFGGEISLTRVFSIRLCSGADFKFQRKSGKRVKFSIVLSQMVQIRLR